MFRATLTALLITATLSGAQARAGGADEAYQDAKDAYLKLKADPEQRKFRHCWQNVARRFEAVTRKFPKSDRAADATFMCGELNAELFRFSQNGEDLAQSEKSYRRFLEQWPRHKLADDVALALGRLLADRGQGAEARRVVSEALAGAADKKKELKALLDALPEEKKAEKKPAAHAETKDPKGAEKTAKPAARAEAKDADEKPARPEAKGADKAAAPKAARADADEKNPAKAAASKPAAKDAEAKGAAAAKEKAQAHAAADERPAARADARPMAVVASRDAGTGNESIQVVLDAIQRASNRAIAAAHLPGQPVVPLEPEKSARRVPPARPAKLQDDEAEAGDDVEEGQVPTLTALQEKLRDVRVGARRPDDPDARARFKSLAKDEQAAELTLAQQLGLKVRRVILDAGHGGHDTGAIGPKGTYEKDVALAITLKLAKRLEAMGLEVLLTRDDDSFVALEERTRFANREKGDLFISIHCNAATSRALRGIETYTLNTSSNRYSVRLAARENASSERGVGDLQYILADLATKANTGESTRLAQRVQQSLVRGVAADHKGVRDLGTKEALFFVLLGAKMPAILVETSFISNPEEEQLLGDQDYQRDVAGNIADAVKGFLEERSRLAQVD